MPVVITNDISVQYRIDGQGSQFTSRGPVMQQTLVTPKVKIGILNPGYSIYILTFYSLRIDFVYFTELRPAA
ncbi:hypothetical protein D3C80_2156110 [compost metagenome]